MTDPNEPDSDEDGLEDGAEVNTHMTDPTVKDSDGDGLEDGEEVIYTKEPQTGWWTRVKAGFAGLFPIKSQL